MDVVGRGEGLGRPLLYGTTSRFLEHFGFSALEELPLPEELPVVLRDRVPLGLDDDEEGDDAQLSLGEASAEAGDGGEAQAEAGDGGEARSDAGDEEAGEEEGSGEGEPREPEA